MMAMDRAAREMRTDFCQRAPALKSFELLVMDMYRSNLMMGSPRILRGPSNSRGVLRLPPFTFLTGV
jgi:hypothetical protein